MRFVGKSCSDHKNICLIQFYLNNTISPFNSAHYIVLYPQNGDRTVIIDSVTSLHTTYTV